MTDVYIFYAYYGAILLSLILTTFSERFYNKYENNSNELVKLHSYHLKNFLKINNFIYRNKPRRI